MRCLSCDKALSDREATRKCLITGEYPDLCNDCFSTISEDVLTTEGTTSLSEDEKDDIYECCDTKD